MSHHISSSTCSVQHWQSKRTNQIISFQGEACMQVHFQQGLVVICCGQLLLMPKELLLVCWNPGFLSNCSSYITYSLLILHSDIDDQRWVLISFL